MEEPGSLQSMESPAVRHDWATSLSLFIHFHFSLSCIGEGNGNPLSVLAWRIPGTGEPGELPSMGSHGVGHDWSNLAAAAADVHSGRAWFYNRGLELNIKSLLDCLWQWLLLFPYLKLSQNEWQKLLFNFTCICLLPSNQGHSSHWEVGPVCSLLESGCSEIYSVI